MIDNWIDALIVMAALGCGVNGGVFFAFSSFVMPALARLPSAQGIAAMQSINVMAVAPAFMTALFGTALACVGLVALSLARWGTPQAAGLLLGGALYLLGNIVVTMVFNVPRNNRLAAADATSAAAARLWADYLKSWTAWNHVRAATAVAAALVLMVAVCQ
jgi:uncharacterized membrane protein